MSELRARASAGASALQERRCACGKRGLLAVASQANASVTVGGKRCSRPAWNELKAVGYANLTMDGVAARAKTSKRCFLSVVVLGDQVSVCVPPFCREGGWCARAPSLI